MKARVLPERFMSMQLYLEMVKKILSNFEGKTYCVSVRYKVKGKEHNKDYIGVISNGEVNFKELVEIKGLESYEIVDISEVKM